ncbi:MAG: DMT family transporter [Pseudomonadota bacterium]
MNRQSQSGAVACLLLAAVTWGSAFAVGKAALTVIDAYHLTSIRYGIAALVFVGWLWRVEGRGALKSDGRAGRILLLGTVGIGGGVLLMFIGLAHTRAEHAAVIVASQPLMAALLGWAFQGRRPARRTLFAIALALTGVGLVVTRGDPRSLSGAAASDLLVLAAALCWVAYTLGAGAFPAWSALRYTALTATAGALSVVAATASAAALGAASVPGAGQIASVGWEIGYITLGSAVLGTLGWNSGIRRIGAEGVLFINFVPVTAFVIGVFQGYRFNWAEIIGSVLVVAALLANHFLAARASALQEEPDERRRSRPVP